MSTWRDLRSYLGKKQNGWEPWKASTHHDYWRKVLPTGEILTIRVSRGTGEIGSSLWREILKHQLQVTMEEFNRGK